MTAQITALPTPPSTNDPANFNTRADAFLGQMPTFVTEANALATEVNGKAAAADASKIAAGTSEANAAASASSALNAPGTNGTSTTGLLIGTGTKVFTTQSGKAWSKGQGVVAASSANPLNQMIGVISAYSGTTLTVEVQSVGGSGTFADWIISMAAGSAIAPASQAQAEAGVIQGVYMDPLRVAQAIAKQAVPISDAAVTVATTLTTSSKYLQIASMALRGVGYTLPAGNAYANGGPKFEFTNTGLYDLPIRDSTGAIKAFIRPGRTSGCFLADNSTAAGLWKFDTASIYGETALYTGNGLGSGTITGMKALSIDSDRDLFIFFTATLIKAVIYTKSTNVWGTWTSVALETVQGNNGLDCQLINSTTALLNWSSSTAGAMKSVVLSFSGSTVTVNTIVTTSYPGASSLVVKMVALSGSWIVLGSDNTNTNIFCFGVSVSGTTVTVSGASTVFSATTAANHPDLGTLVIGSTLVVMSYTSATNGFQARAMTISGSTVTQGALFNVAGSSNPAFKFTLLANGRIFVAYSNGSLVVRSLSVSGTTISSGTAISANISDTNFTNINITNLGSNRVLVVYTAGVVEFANIFTDSSGVITTGGAAQLTFAAAAGGFRTGIVGADVYFVRVYQSSNGSILHKIDCSGNTPVFSELTLVPTVGSGAGIFNPSGLIENTPDDIPYSLSPGGSSMVGANGMFDLQHTSLSSYDTLVFNPGMQRLIQDHVPSTATVAGKTRAERYELYSISAVVFVVRKFETTT